MNETRPDTGNSLAAWVGRLVHPYLLPIPTILLLLNDLAFLDALFWMALTVGLIVLPGVVLATVLQRRGRMTYQRRTRGTLYLVGWVCVMVCLLILKALEAPLVLIASVVTLAVWVPMQWTVNTWVTKISGHAAVAVGCFSALALLGKLALPVLFALLVITLLTLWARVVTHNHTISQVALGVLVGLLPVLIVFPMMLQ